MDNNLFIKKVIFDREKVDNFDKYPFNIDIIKNLDELTFDSPVTFLVGENGVGKSTFIESLAISIGLNAEGGTQNFDFHTKDTHSSLSRYITVAKYGKPKTKFFLRAESFYNFQTEMQRLVEEDSFYSLYNAYGGNLHECSHGESFLKLIKNRFTDHGLYILDEPEAALSPQRQMSLLCLIDDLVKNGSQFIIATHSPILISYINGKILDLNDEFKEIKYEETDIYKIYKLYLDNAYSMQEKLFKDI
ncbi:MAG: AAA family ATPase [Bacilli bacterium]|nr:AAA family ATPase [Bacilli bacterium]MCI9434439.1 AAA family ATPase [Bacilli bacterium]